MSRDPDRPPGAPSRSGKSGPEPGLAIIIVHYDTPELLRACLAHLASDPPALEYRILVVDNASPGARVREVAGEFPDVEFHYNARNVGFARACNQGIRATAGPYCLLLNPDALLGSAAIRDLVELLAFHPFIGAAAPRLVNPDGSVQWSCRRFPTLRVLLIRAARLDRLFRRTADAYLMRDWDHAAPRRVDWALGACLLLRRDAVEGVGLLDGGFYMYYEDVDLCYRLRAGGWETWYVPQAVVPHVHQRGSATLWPGRLARAHARSLVRLWRKGELPW